jgi:hypothetical protein
MHWIPSLPTNSVSTSRHNITLLSEHVHRCEILRKSIFRYKLPHFAIFGSVLLSLMIYKNSKRAYRQNYLRKDERLQEDEIKHWRLCFGLASCIGTTVRAIIRRLSDPHVITDTTVDSGVLYWRPCVAIGIDHASVGLKWVTSRSSLQSWCRRLLNELSKLEENDYYVW